MEAMKKMSDKAFDLAIVDPPYGTGNVKKYNKKFKNDSKKWNKNIPPSKYFSELCRVSKNQIIWGGNYFTKYLSSTKSWIFWYKDFNGNTNGFADGELAWTSLNVQLKVFKFCANDGRQNVITKIHPTQKPVQLYKWLLKKYAKEGNNILDTHLGSGSIAIACWDMGFDLTAHEIDEESYKGTMNRFENHKRQGQLF